MPLLLTAAQLRTVRKQANANNAREQEALAQWPETLASLLADVAQEEHATVALVQRGATLRIAT